MRRNRLLLLALAYVGFVSLGLPDGILGVAWPSIRRTFGLGLDALGPLLIASTSGYVLSSFSSGWILQRMTVGALLALSCLATAASLLGYANAPVWAVMVAFGTLAGGGAGAIDAGLNSYVARHHGARTLNWLHAFYGLGAAGGPAIMTAVLMSGHAWQRGYAIVGMAQLGLAACFALTRRRWTTDVVEDRSSPTSSNAERARATASSWSTLRLPATSLGMLAFFVYTGLEGAAGAWAYSLFTEAWRMPASSAGMWVSAFWGGLCAGRLLFGCVVGLAPLKRLMRTALIAIACGTVLLVAGDGSMLSGVGLTLIGLASGPVFPSLIATTPARLGPAHTANGVGFQIAAAALGQSLLPAGMGVLTATFGLTAVGPGLLVAAVSLIGVHEILCRTGAAPDHVNGDDERVRERTDDPARHPPAAHDHVVRVLRSGAA